MIQWERTKLTMKRIRFRHIKTKPCLEDSALLRRLVYRPVIITVICSVLVIDSSNIASELTAWTLLSSLPLETQSLEEITQVLGLNHT